MGYGEGGRLLQLKGKSTAGGGGGGNRGPGGSGLPGSGGEGTVTGRGKVQGEGVPGWGLPGSGGDPGSSGIPEAWISADGDGGPGACGGGGPGVTPPVTPPLTLTTPAGGTGPPPCRAPPMCVGSKLTAAGRERANPSGLGCVLGSHQCTLSCWSRSDSQVSWQNPMWCFFVKADNLQVEALAGTFATAYRLNVKRYASARAWHFPVSKFRQDINRSRGLGHPLSTLLLTGPGPGPSASRTF